jgi:hypothetical protein
MAFKWKKLVAKTLAVFGAIALAAALNACAALWPVAGAGIGAGVGSIAGPGGSVVGAAGGAAVGEALAGAERLEDERAVTLDVVEALVKAASQEARDAALSSTAAAMETNKAETLGVVEQLKTLLVALAKWAAVALMLYFAGKVAFSKKQKLKLLGEIEEKINGQK